MLEACLRHDPAPRRAEGARLRHVPKSRLRRDRGTRQTTRFSLPRGGELQDVVSGAGIAVGVDGDLTKQVVRRLYSNSWQRTTQEPDDLVPGDLGGGGMSRVGRAVRVVVLVTVGVSHAWL